MWSNTWIQCPTFREVAGSYGSTCIRDAWPSCQLAHFSSLPNVYMSIKACFVYTGAVFAALAAIFTGVVIQLSQIPSDIQIRLDERTESIFQPALLTPQQIETYEKEGVVFVPGLLTQDESTKLVVSGEYAMSRVFQFSKLFGTRLYSGLGFDLWRTSPEVASFALQSLPKVVAPILSYSKNPQNEVEFRLLKDAMFQYKAGGEGCGWHVDDVGFWPTEESTDGPTIWIALDEIKVVEGGGLALVNRTLFDQISNVTLEFCRQAIKEGTCNMAKLSPECYAKMEASKMEWDMKAGDAIIWNRWTFHRGVAAAVADVDPDSFVKRRYSVRYTPYGSRAGPIIHPSVGAGNLFDSPFYPKVWPKLKADEMAAIEHGLEPDAKLSRMLPFAVKLILKKFFPSIKLGS